MQFNREDMDYTHYRWDSNPAHAAALFSGEPSRREFDPFNGNQVLYVINYFGSLTDNFTIKDARRIERALAYQLPADVRSEKSVLTWLMEQVTATE